MKDLTILIPCYNEKDNLIRNIPILRERFTGSVIMIVENGSSVAPEFPGLLQFRIKQRGIGVALRFGLQQCWTSYCVFLPADLSYDLSFVWESIPLLIQEYDIVIGNKYDKKSMVERPLKRRFMSFGYEQLLFLIYGLPIHDFTGTKAWRVKSIQPLLEKCHSDGIQFEVELLRQAFRNNLKVAEIPVKVRDFNQSRFLQ